MPSAPNNRRKHRPKIPPIGSVTKQSQVQVIVPIGSVDVLDYTVAKKGSRGKTSYSSKHLGVLMADD